ncbi:MAG: SBBP repeat-containing protein, partial [Nitrosomonas sp.]
WVAWYNGSGNAYDGANSIAVDNSGNVYVTGRSRGSGTSDDYATLKYNVLGALQWVSRYNGTGNLFDGARSIAVDGSGNVYVTGQSTGTGTSDDYTTIKYNALGDQQWVSRYNGTGNFSDVASSIAVDGFGNVYVTGSSYINGINYDYATVKYNFLGEQQWVARYNSPDNLYALANSIAVDGSGNVYVTGSIYSIGTYSDYTTIKYNSSGVQQWVSRYNGTGNDADEVTSIAVDESGFVYVTGWSSGSGTALDYATIKYNSFGIQQWVARYNGTGNSYDLASSLVLDGSGNVYVTGWSFGNGTSYDYATLKYNSSGVQQWLRSYNGFGEDSTDVANSLAVDNSGNVYVTGQSIGNGTGYDYATIKYSQSVGIKQLSSILPNRFSISQNYPNPFNPSTKIKFDIAKSGLVKLIIFDISGKEVASLVEENLSPGSYETEFDGSKLTSGVYFYKIETGSFTETKKMLMIK